MRILVSTVQVPFVRGGAEAHANRLCEELNKAGHEAEIVAIPYRWYPPQLIMDHLMACRLLNLENCSGKSVDRVVGLKFPAYHVRHPNKVIWMLHQHRTAYELWDHPNSDLSKTRDGVEVRDALRRADTELLGEAEKIFTNSKTVAKRLFDYCERPGTPLYHPPPLADEHFCDGDAGYLFFPSRICGMKRQHLAIEALATLGKNSKVKLCFSGAVDEDKYFQKLQKLVEKHGLNDRVIFRGHVSKVDFLSLYAQARAVVYTPLDEDYGYVSLESMLSKKPVVTVADTGGVMEFIDEDVGWVTDSNPEALGQALQEAWDNASACAEKGVAAYERYQALGISWQNAVEQLTR